MKKKIICLALTLVMCLSFVFPASAAGTCTNKHFCLLAYGYCNATHVNVRTGPGTNYKSVGQANKGDKYYFYDVTDVSSADWCHVHGEHIGWMYDKYYTAVEAAGITYEEL